MNTEEKKDKKDETGFAGTGCCSENFRWVSKIMKNCCAGHEASDGPFMMKAMMEMCCGPKAESTKGDSKMIAKLMKSILVTVMAVTLTCGLATAGGKMKAYEMGESGQVVLFPMTPQEIAAEAAEGAKLAAIKRSETEAPMVKTFELAESGEILTYPMSAEGIRAAKAARTEVKSVRSKQTDVTAEEYELSESGITISLLMKSVEESIAN